MKRPTIHDFTQFFRDIPGTLTGSVQEFAHLTSIAAAGMFLAISIVLSMFSIYLSESLRISPAFLATAMMGMFLGPVMGGVTAAAGDVIKYFIRPSGAFFPGFTLTALLSGFVYGLFLYKNKVTLPRVICAKVIINVFFNVGLNTLWTSMMAGIPFWVNLGPRLIANLAQFPFQLALLYIVLQLLASILPRISTGHRRTTR